MSEFSLHNKIALVTGASRGIGFHLSLELARLGAHVVAVARSVEGLESLDDAIKTTAGSCTLVPLDLQDMAAIDRLGAHIHERWGQLDILIANAGVLGVISPISHIEAQTFAEVMTVNVTSQWRLIRAVASLLQKSPHGRALIMSSSVAHTARPFWSAYAASKAAVEVLARCWAEETKQTPLRINIVNPGATRTEMRAKAMPGEDPMDLPSPEEVARAIVPLVAPDLEETGQLYDFRRQKFVTIAPPN